MIFWMSRSVQRCVAAAVLAGLAQAGAADTRADWADDVAGGQDHPLIRRFDNSWLMAYQQLEFDATHFPSRLGLGSQLDYPDPVEVGGRITRLVYFAPQGKTPLEVHRNYEQALAAAGFKAQVSCTPKVAKCEHMTLGFRRRYDAMKEADFHANRRRQPEGSKLGDQMRNLGGTNMLGTDDIYFSYGTLSRNGVTVHVMLNTGKVYSTDFTTTYLEIAEPKAMSTGQVAVNADALQTGLHDEGKIALYGIYFDTGKAEVKPESKPQLDEIAKLLTAQPALQVYLVGHTDNQGGLDANLALSQRRAQAVAEALSKGYRIDAKRLIARGVASLVPVASNAGDEGRARNRRVELVLP